MRTHLLATTALVATAAATVALAGLLPAAAQAQDITTAITTPVSTSTAANGSPGAIRITSTGSVKPTSAAAAVTMNTNHNVTNEGTIQVSNINGATGILVNAGTVGDISNTGTISIDEDYTPADSDADGDLDGPFANGTGRAAIRTLGAHNGAISVGGTVTVEGNNSYGLYLGGPQTGAVTHTANTRVTGNTVTGVRLDDVTGNVRLAGTIEARGANAIGAHLAGDVTGRVTIQGTIIASGYRNTSAPTSTVNLDADDLLQGGPAVLVEGNVTGGIVVAVPPRDTNPDNADEDGDGLPDATEGSGLVRSFGSAPAMVIGHATDDIVIGAVSGPAGTPNFGLQVEGIVNGSGVYALVDATGMQIAGRGGDVTIANGISVSGAVQASSIGGNATALVLGAGTITPVLQVSGAVEASGANAGTRTATGLQVDAGAQVPTVRNSGRIRGIAGADGNAYGIRDLSGNLDLVENTGAISASGATATSTRNVAIDLSANNGGAIVRQSVVAAGVSAPSIEGDIRFGTGDDRLELADGSYKGTTYFGAGADRLVMSGDATFDGRANFGGGADQLNMGGSALFTGTADFAGAQAILTLANSARFAGSLANAGNLAINTSGGVLDVSNTAAIASLNMGAGSTLMVTLSKTAGAGTMLNVSGNATFAAGSTVAVRVADIANAEGTYLFLDAGSMTGASNLQITQAMLPFLFKSTLGIDALESRLSVTITRKSATELGLNSSQGAAFNAVLAALGEDEELEDLFLATSDGAAFRTALDQLLPDHAGGTFEGISLGLRTLARQQTDPTGPTFTYGGLDVIVDGAVWNSSKDAGTTARYDLAGVGASVAAEVDTDYGAFGTAIAWMFNDYDQGDELSSVYSHSYELALYWRGEWDGLKAFGRGSVGLANFNGERTLRGTLGGTTVERTAEGDWSGNFTTLQGGASYELGGGGLFVRPSVTVDYVSLSENAFEDDGGGDGFDLIVEKRSSDELAVNGGLAAGIDFMGRGAGDRNWFRVEGEGGWREIVGGALGATTARFDGGTPFTLTPEERASGWYARARAVGGGELFELGGEVAAEQRESATALSLRGTLRMAF